MGLFPSGNTVTSEVTAVVAAKRGNAFECELLEFEVDAKILLNRYQFRPQSLSLSFFFCAEYYGPKAKSKAARLSCVGEEKNEWNVARSLDSEDSTLKTTQGSFLEVF